MAKGFAIHNALTDHGGLIPSTQVRSSQQGNLFVRAGDGHFCPKCKCWSTVVKSHDHIIFDGKAVAYVNDLLTCGARIQPQQSHVVGDSQGVNYQTSQNNTSINSIQNNLIDGSLKEIYKIQFKLLDEDSGDALPEMLYEIYSKDNGKLLVQGYTDQYGMTALYESEYSPESIEIITMDLSKPLPPLN